MNGAKRYNFDQLKDKIDEEFFSENISEKIYQSTNGITRIMNAIVKTKGDNWAAQVLDDQGQPMLNPQEQQKFTEAFQPYISTILNFFGEEHPEIIGGDASQIEVGTGPDDIYSKIVHTVGNINSTVNDYASKYGVLKLEKQYDSKPDIHLIPMPARKAISAALTVTGIPPLATDTILSKIKLPLRTIITMIYLGIDILRVSMTVSDSERGRKLLSVLLSILELLRGQWKEAIFTFMGYFGTQPLFFGQVMKSYVMIFKMLSPEIQDSIIFGSLDAVKSLFIGTLLSIFQLTAPEELRRPMVESLDKIAAKKAEMDGILEQVDLPPRPDYLVPSWQDLNNLQAVITDEDYLCSCEFQQIIENIAKPTIVRVVLQVLRIPTNEDMIRYKCGNRPCEDFPTTVVQHLLERQGEPVKTDEKIAEEGREEGREEGENAVTEMEKAADESKEEEEENPVSINNTRKQRNEVSKSGRRILHSHRKNKITA
jgi:hypothetical protein